MHVVLIDNYDSFTWNLYQYICQEGAQVEVYRNDQITLNEIENIDPDIILISPGPGHPKTDSGISRDVIKHFTGKIPVFGVCMGQQCIFEVFGGSVEYAGEIVHGKTTLITHDGKGLFTSIPQNIAVTRYHSLAGTVQTLPDELEITAQTPTGIIMGVRHKKYTVEGVQFHPESILTEEGHLMIKNMLNTCGKTWEENKLIHENKISNNKKVTKNTGKSILNEIYDQRKKDVESQKLVPGHSFKQLNELYDLGLAPNVINFYDRLKAELPKSALIAEIKRASPSKGPINLEANSASQALKYANTGVAAISVLTEPHWFKGSIEDLRNVRNILEVSYEKDCGKSRPAILRKEFIFSEYQILEARLAGADSVLLIVKMLDDLLLKRLYDYSLLLKMEPLVEVSSLDEMKRAIKLKSKVIGVNNRDLHSFHVDLNTTSSLVSIVPKDTILCALSGISSGKDTAKYKEEGVHGFLVGEALMKSNDINKFVDELVCE
ncbi:bifunctional anthranilate synthase/indole-3-glycerol-phosphate synthase [Ascoidea rubescens DSM 1968]|uniref:Multifunctional tryptophan biosynthesis protein n=1 Tax=Ascoidea rubescens DSM 1968 TaxID=1344418 RepID=A0A1D2VI86_9ASCO|nr:IGPS-domain-containing protein [Ascoidea rubescens DSM 1968]ODV61358.1 IGPS-domain-containing protein [Ascoidea rubescens DSM 1968]